MKKLFSILFIFSILFGAFSFVSAQERPIRVGSKQFTEQLILGQMILVALEDAGLEVEDRTNLGGTNVNREALVNGEIDVYPEYTGTTIFNQLPDFADSFPEGASSDAYLSYATVSSFDAAANDLIWLQPAPANNSYNLALRRDFAEENGIESLQDLANFINEGNPVTLVSGDEFPSRPDGLPAFEETYGFDLSADQIIEIAGGTTAQTEQALAEGTNDANIGMAFATDGALSAFDLVVFDDVLGAQAVFQPAPVFRGEVIRANPQIASILNPIFVTLDAFALQELNARVDVDGENPADVARSYLEANGFIGN